MARPELGTKRVCPTTGRKFYDLDRDPVVSPYTGESWPRSAFEPQLKASSSASSSDDDEEDTASSPAAEFVPLDEADPTEVKEAVADDIEIDPDIAADDDDTFLETEEEGDDDVADLIDGDIEGEEEA